MKHASKLGNGTFEGKARLGKQETVQQGVKVAEEQNQTTALRRPIRNLS